MTTARAQIENLVEALDDVPVTDAEAQDTVERLGSAREVWRLIDEIGDDILQPDYPQELVDADLREMGLDPEELGRRGVEFVERVKAGLCPICRRVPCAPDCYRLCGDARSEEMSEADDA